MSFANTQDRSSSRRLIATLFPSWPASPRGSPPAREKPEPVSPFRLGGHAPLGAGACGSVLPAKNLRTGERVAIKLSNRRSNHQDLVREAKVLERLSRCPHPNVIALHAHGSAEALLEDSSRLRVATEGSYAIVMERARGDLFDHISRCGALSEEAARALFAGVAAGLAHVHSCGVAHLDIKLENILLASKGKGGKRGASAAGCSAKLVDFGLSYLHKEGVLPVEKVAPLAAALASPSAHGRSRLRGLVGSAGYVAPEVVDSESADVCYDGFEADIWSLGVVLFEVRPSVPSVPSSVPSSALLPSPPSSTTPPTTVSPSRCASCCTPPLGTSLEPSRNLLVGAYRRPPLLGLQVAPPLVRQGDWRTGNGADRGPLGDPARGNPGR